MSVRTLNVGLQVYWVDDKMGGNQTSVVELSPSPHGLYVNPCEAYWGDFGKAQLTLAQVRKA